MTEIKKLSCGLWSVTAEDTGGTDSSNFGVFNQTKSVGPGASVSYLQIIGLEIRWIFTTWLVQSDVLWYCMFNTNFLNIDNVYLWGRYFTANLLNSLWPSGAIWRHKSKWTLTRVKAWCLTAPSHQLNQCWLIISEVQWYPADGNFIRNTLVLAPAINR